MIDSTKFGIGSSIPVVPMALEDETKEFYLEFLGYEIDWEHRFNSSQNSELYMLIHLGDSVLHLNGHADPDSAPIETRIPVEHLQEYAQFLCQKKSRFGMPQPVDPRYEGKNTDMNIRDPFGNLLTFWLRESK